MGETEVYCVRSTIIYISKRKIKITYFNQVFGSVDRNDNETITEGICRLLNDNKNKVNLCKVLENINIIAYDFDNKNCVFEYDTCVKVVDI